MTTRLITGCLGVLTMLAAPGLARAQATPPATPPASAPSELPTTLPPASPAPAAPSAPSAQLVVPVPPANAVALCGDGSFVQAPAGPAACGTRGGLRLVLPTRPSGPPPRPVPELATPAVMAAPAAASQPPAGATMRCKDGTWLSGAPAAERCTDRGGVATVLPPERVPPR